MCGLAALISVTLVPRCYCRSNNEVKDKTEKPFGLAYVNLLQDDGTTLRNTRHELNVYKVRDGTPDNSSMFIVLKVQDTKRERSFGLD